MKKNFFRRKKKEFPKTETSCIVLDLEKEEAPMESKKSKYLEAFIKPRVLKQRQSVYISQDVHELVSKIVGKLGIKNMTVGVFIDTILMQHIKEHKEELMSIYYKEEHDIFENILGDNSDD
ncbi:DUF3408 domain-containing protein [Bacteroides sp. 519]|uniref:DUF3408 domain-containing protein n=1 Tax=Bacteroides sp. 519 TaxID=2302937 RepID=UPI0013D4E68B|nr:DUF3408 domain-containing protein [Bacteroides sp. 519]NDV57959.1 DUF3408 domain-containing protein [Bacteroides sp. 519]